MNCNDCGSKFDFGNHHCYYNVNQPTECLFFSPKPEQKRGKCIHGMDYICMYGCFNKRIVIDHRPKWQD